MWIIKYGLICLASFFVVSCGSISLQGMSTQKNVTEENKPLPALDRSKGVKAAKRYTCSIGYVRRDNDQRATVEATRKTEKQARDAVRAHCKKYANFPTITCEVNTHEDPVKCRPKY